MLALIFLLNNSLYALDKEKLAKHVRESMSIPAKVEVMLGDPQPSEVPGFDSVELQFKWGENVQKNRLYISSDGFHYFMGEVQDLRIDLDAERVKKINLKDVPFKGSAGAKVVLVEYSDVQCPYCARAHQVLSSELIKTYGDKVKWVYKTFPLTQIHPWAEPAAIAVYCAKRQKTKAFWEMLDAFFGAQKDITAQNVKDKALESAKASKLNVKKFTGCYDKKEGLEDVKKDVQEAESLGVNSTPSIFINGHKLPGMRGFEDIQGLVDEFLQGKH